jgi:hypothetical protein
MRPTTGVLLVCLAVLLLVLLEKDRLREHWLFFTEDRTAVTFDFIELSESWTVDTLRQRFSGSPIRCYPNPGDGLGDLGCIVDTMSHNGVPSLFISFFFASGHLQQVSVNIPWWNHSEAYSKLTTTFGEPLASQLLPYHGVRLQGWRMADGAGLFYNRDRAINPLDWNAIYWRSASSCKASPCFRGQLK